MQDPPSWQQLKAKALEADYGSMADFIDNYHTRAGVGRSAAMNSNMAQGSKTMAATSTGFFGSMDLSSSGRAAAYSPSWTAGRTVSTPHQQRSASATRAPANSADGKKKDDSPTFEKWFTDRFPENNITSAPAAHKALWAEHERQARYKRVEGRRKSNEDAGSYLDRLRLGSSNGRSSKRLSDVSDIVDTPVKERFKSGSTESPGRVLRTNGTTTLHVVTWKVERWSALPSGFRQGARYRPPGGNAWSLDLYKGGIKRERPGMVALYVHYDAPHDDAFATVTSLELSLMNQTTGAHLMRKHEGTRIFGPKADPAKRVSTSAGTVRPHPFCFPYFLPQASLAHVVLTQVEALGFCVNDTVVLRAEIEVLQSGNPADLT